MKAYKVLSMATFLLVSLGAQAEDAAYSASALPLAPTPIQSKKEVKHGLNRYDYALYGGIVAYRVGDYYTTERLLAVHGREVELPDCFVDNRAGFLAYSLGMAALQIEGSMYLHRHHHAKLARFVDAVSISAGVATDLHNVRTIHTQERYNLALGD